MEAENAHSNFGLFRRNLKKNTKNRFQILQLVVEPTHVEKYARQIGSFPR